MLKRILLILLGASILLGSLYAESLYSRNIRPANISLLDFAESADFEIRTDQDNQWHIRASGEIPRYIRANKESQFTFAESFFITLQSDSVLKLVALDKGIIHLRLVSGEMTYNNQIPPEQLVFLQTNRFALEPWDFSTGTLSINEDTQLSFTQHQGSSVATFFAPNQSKRETLIVQTETISIAESEVSNSFVRLNPFNLKEKLNSNGPSLRNRSSYPVTNLLAQLKQKQQAIKINPVPDLLSKYIFSKSKQASLLKSDIYQLSQNLINQLRVNQQLSATNTIRDIDQKIVDMQLIDSKQHEELLKELLKLTGGLTPEDRFHPFKEVVLKNTIFAPGLVGGTSTLNLATLLSPKYINLSQVIKQTNKLGGSTDIDVLEIHYRYLHSLLSYPKYLNNETLAILFSDYDQIVATWPEKKSELYTAITIDLTEILAAFNQDEDVTNQQKNSINQKAIEVLEEYHNKSTIPQNFQIYIEENLPLN